MTINYHSCKARLLRELKALSLPSWLFAQESRPTGKDYREALWVEPALVVDVEFLEWTPGLHIRHPSFKGMQRDRDPRDVRREVPTK